MAGEYKAWQVMVRWGRARPGPERQVKAGEVSLGKLRSVPARNGEAGEVWLVEVLRGMLCCGMARNGEAGEEWLVWLRSARFVLACIGKLYRGRRGLAGSERKEIFQ